MNKKQKKAIIAACILVGTITLFLSEISEINQSVEEPSQETSRQASTQFTGSFEGELGPDYVFDIETESLEYTYSENNREFYQASLRFELTEFGERVLQSENEREVENLVEESFEIYPEGDYARDLIADVNAASEGRISDLEREVLTGNLEEFSENNGQANIVISVQEGENAEIKWGSFSTVWTMSTSGEKEGVVDVDSDGVVQTGESGVVQTLPLESGEVSSSGAPSFSTSTGDEDEWVPVAPDSGTDQGFDHFFDESDDSEYFSEEEGFYVMKYEAKENSSVETVSTGDYMDGQDVSVPVSTAEDTPWTSIPFNDSEEYEFGDGEDPGAVHACEALNEVDDVGDDYDFHLITNREWMTVARQIEQTDGNWVDGVAPEDGDDFSEYQLIRGNSDGDDPYSASTDDGDGFYQLDDGEIEGDFNERTFELANGEVVWDWSGNVLQWTYAEESDGVTTDNGVFNETNPDGKEYEKDPAVVDRSTDGVGSDFGFDEGRAALRGGLWYNGVRAGVFLASSTDPDTSDTRRGFRCSAVPVS